MGMRICPIRVGNCRWPRSYMIGVGEGNDEVIDTPHMIFYIDGADKKVLVDTGGVSPQADHNKKFHSSTYTQTPEEEVAYALKQATGVDPSEIDVVIITHLHWDHAQNCHLFPQAEFYVQIKEIYATINPIPRFGGTYEAFNAGVVPCWAKQPVKWNFLDGDAEILPGIRVYITPGHCAGMQVVMVDTDQGPYLLGSDAFPLYDHILPDGTLVPNTLCNSLEESYYSSVRITKIAKDQGATVIPGHDIKVLDQKWYPA